jgi:hypothetical protein
MLHLGIYSVVLETGRSPGSMHVRPPFRLAHIDSVWAHRFCLVGSAVGISTANRTRLSFVGLSDPQDNLPSVLRSPTLVPLVDVVMTNIVIVVDRGGCQRGQRTMTTMTICRSRSRRRRLGSGGQTQSNMKAAVQSTHVQ